MSSRPASGRGDWSAEMRKQSGAYLRDARLKAGLTQAQLAKQVGLAYFTMISQLEQGRGFIPPDRYLEFASALGIEPKAFVADMLRFQNPWAHAILWGGKPAMSLLREVTTRFSEEP